MTKYKAWMRLYHEWETVTRKDSYSVKDRDCFGDGICINLIHMWSNGLITDSVFDAMKKLIPHQRPYSGYAWKWHSKSGAESRAAFCLKQAKLLRRKK